MYNYIYIYICEFDIFMWIHTYDVLYIVAEIYDARPHCDDGGVGGGWKVALRQRGAGDVRGLRWCESHGGRSCVQVWNLVMYMTPG